MALSRGAMLLARAVLVTACVFSMALGAHLLGGGGLPDPLLATTAASLLLLITTLLARVRLRPLVLLGLLGTAQFVLHHAFAVPPAGSCHGGAHHHGVMLDGATVQGCMHHHHDFGWQMFAAHAIATVLTTVLIADAERALWAVAGWLRPLLGIPAPAPLPGCAPMPALAAYRRRLPPRPVRDPATPLRAPPQVTVAA